MEDKKSFINGYMIGQSLNLIVEHLNEIWVVQNDDTLILLQADTITKDDRYVEVE